MKIGWCTCGDHREVHADWAGRCSQVGCTCRGFRERLSEAEIVVARVEELVAWAKDNYMREIDTNDVLRALEGRL